MVKIDTSAARALLLELLALPVVAGAASAASAQWSADGGDSRRSGWVQVLGTEGNAVRWVSGFGTQAPTQPLVDGNIVMNVSHQNITDPVGGSLLVATNLQTGATLWTSASIPGVPQNVGWRIKLCGLRGGVAYVSRAGNTVSAKLVALSAGNGQLIWTSSDDIKDDTLGGVAFASDGDLIIQGVDRLLKIDATTGQTEWSVPRFPPSSDGESVCCVNGRIYGWEIGSQVTVFEESTGLRLFSTSFTPNIWAQQTMIFAAPDGTIMAPRTTSSAAYSELLALDDIGSALVVRWSKPLPYVPLGSFAVSDSCVYTYLPGMQIAKVDLANGSVLATSQSILAQGTPLARMALDRSGRLYVTNGQDSNAGLFFFDSSLNLVWSRNIGKNSLGGPAIAPDGSVLIGNAQGTLCLLPPSSSSVYCVGKPNSAGCVPAIGAVGYIANSGGVPCDVSAINVVNQKSGLLIWSPLQGGTPFLGGTLCLQAPVRRTPVQSSGGNLSGLDCTGQFQLNIAEYLRTTGLIASLVGGSVYAQYWYRDQGTTGGAGLSNAIELPVFH